MFITEVKVIPEREYKDDDDEEEYWTAERSGEEEECEIVLQEIEDVNIALSGAIQRLKPRGGSLKNVAIPALFFLLSFFPCLKG